MQSVSERDDEHHRRSRRHPSGNSASHVTIVRYLITAALIVVGAGWIGQGLNILAGSGMSGQPIFALLGPRWSPAGMAGWSTWRSTRG